MFICYDNFIKPSCMGKMAIIFLFLQKCVILNIRKRLVVLWLGQTDIPVQVSSNSCLRSRNALSRRLFCRKESIMKPYISYQGYTGKVELDVITRLYILNVMEMQVASILWPQLRNTDGRLL